MLKPGTGATAGAEPATPTVVYGLVTAPMDGIAPVPVPGGGYTFAPWVASQDEKGICGGVVDVGTKGDILMGWRDVVVDADGNGDEDVRYDGVNGWFVAFPKFIP